jgi:uncharacterized protein YgiM (DUF1202 family)
MKGNPNIRFIAYLLVMTLFLTLDLNFETKSTLYAEESTNSAPITNAADGFTDFALSKRWIMYNYPDIAFKNKVEEAPIVEKTSEKEPIHKEQVVVIIDYEVTAYHLNIRSSASDLSEIINVASKGTVLEITDTTNTGWLHLKSGGYVNGKYTKPKKRNNDKSRIAAPGKPSISVKSDSGLEALHIEKLFKGTPLAGEGLGKIIMEMEAKYGINAYFTIAVMKLESGNGKSSIAKNKNNLFGLNAIDGNASKKAFSFKSKGDSIRKFGQLISYHYLGKGYTTVEKVSKKYCQANPKWTGLVTNIMNSDYKKLQQI